MLSEVKGSGEISILLPRSETYTQRCFIVQDYGNWYFRLNSNQDNYLFSKGKSNKALSSLCMFRPMNATASLVPAVSLKSEVSPG